MKDTLALRCDVAHAAAASGRLSFTSHSTAVAGRPAVEEIPSQGCPLESSPERSPDQSVTSIDGAGEPPEGVAGAGGGLRVEAVSPTAEATAAVVSASFSRKAVSSAPTAAASSRTAATACVSSIAAIASASSTAPIAAAPTVATGVALTAAAPASPQAAASRQRAVIGKQVVVDCEVPNACGGGGGGYDGDGGSGGGRGGVNGGPAGAITHDRDAACRWARRVDGGALQAVDAEQQPKKQQQQQQQQQQSTKVAPAVGSRAACDGGGGHGMGGDGVSRLGSRRGNEVAAAPPGTSAETAAAAVAPGVAEAVAVVARMASPRRAQKNATKTTAGAGAGAGAVAEAVAAAAAAAAAAAVTTKVETSVWDLDYVDFEEEEEEEADERDVDEEEEQTQEEADEGRARGHALCHSEEPTRQGCHRRKEGGLGSGGGDGRVPLEQTRRRRHDRTRGAHQTSFNKGIKGIVCGARGIGVNAGGKASPPPAAAGGAAVPCDRAMELMPPPPPNISRAKMRRRRSRVSLMHSPRYQRLCGLLERHGQRDDLLYALLGACGLPGRLTVVPPARATDVHLRAYHDRDYVQALRNPPSDVKTLIEYGLVEDCEVFEELFDYCCAVVGASLHAADRLCRGEADVAINWGGGRHHAKKGQAAGFCYVNDGVLAVLHLTKAFGTVLSIDIDVHHGDGMQEAFYMSNKVMTLSFHHLAQGFFPGAGQCSETGAGTGLDFNLNIPLKEGCGDASFLRVFSSALEAVSQGFQPEAVVLLCGADTLSADPLGPFNLTSGGVRACVELVMALELPLLLLGGGGYCPTDTARLWTSLTATAVGAEAVAALPPTVPDHAYFPLYGPDFRLATTGKKTLPDKNDDVFLGRLCDFAVETGRRLSAARRKRESPSSLSSTAFRDFRVSDYSSDSW